MNLFEEAEKVREAVWNRWVELKIQGDPDTFTECTDYAVSLHSLGVSVEKAVEQACNEYKGDLK